MAPTLRKRPAPSQADSNKQQKSSTQFFTPPKNPKATLGGLPAELRLQIYGYLCDSRMIHVYDLGKNGKSIFKYTPCRGTNPNSPLLFANPKWSGLCKDELRCTYDISLGPPEVRGLDALSRTCKTFRSETQEFLTRDPVFSIRPANLLSWLEHLSEKQINSLRRVNLAGGTTRNEWSGAECDQLRRLAPNLEAVGIQSQDPWSTWLLDQDGRPFEASKMQDWAHFHNLTRAFDPTITVAAESTIWSKTDSTSTAKEAEEQVVIQIFRKGKRIEELQHKFEYPWPFGSGSEFNGWQPGDFRLEVRRPGKLVVKHKNAPWRKWWRHKVFKV